MLVIGRIFRRGGESARVHSLVGISAPKKRFSPPLPQFPADTLLAPPPASPGEPPPLGIFNKKPNRPTLLDHPPPSPTPKDPPILKTLQIVKLLWGVNSLRR